MKVMKVIFLSLGVVALIVAGSMLFMALMVELKVIWEIATRYSTDTNLRDPRNNILIISGVTLGAGLLLGLGLGMPTKRSLSDRKLDQLLDARIKERLADNQTLPTDSENA